MPSPVASHELTAKSLTEIFERTNKTRPTIFRAPGRVNLIGEHTDYNDGFVMPAAIGFYTWVAASRRADRTLHVRSQEFDETLDLSLDSLGGPPRKHWSDFVRGVAAVLQSGGSRLSGANLVIQGQVPMGAGLSSSASMEVATALALLEMSQTELPGLDIVKMCQRAEHEYVGTRCGIMDQFIAVFARSAHALMLDCRSLDYQTLAIPSDVRLVICNSMVKHVLAAGEYNRRRADCETGVGILRKHMAKVIALRDVTLDDLEAHKGEVPEVVYRRCRHVISENQRVLDAAGALRSGDLNHFGRLMNESHSSLRNDYEVSCRELDVLVRIATDCRGVYGSRMTGGGFGGCTITLVRTEAVEHFSDKITRTYKNETGITPDVYVCAASQGAGEWRGPADES
ncbi:MAG TPA: galactokinase [Candidatus Dormibacteraeota bacterium]|nr:galactokinase [Candidatus Dormibacteraeota bacterium]